MDFDIQLFTEIRDEARHGVLKNLQAPILGSDIRRDAITFSINNARAAGVGHLIHFEPKDIQDFRPLAGPPGTLICNPPYGERLGEEKDLEALYQTLGQVLRERCSGWTAFIFTGNARLARHIHLEPVEEVPLFNGKIPCRLLKYQLD
jgi:putative N6-adenine-specific DNA methylase